MNKSTKKPRRIGILGGTFNPVHNRHIEIAMSARSQFMLDEVLLIVANDPPHKAVEVSANERLHMVRLSTKGIPCLSASDIELEREGKSYTFDTLTQLKELMHGAEFYIILGDDMLYDLHTWYRAQELLRLLEVIAIPRGADAALAREKASELHTEYGAKVHVLDIPVSPVSSTLIRERVHNALPISGLVPPNVEFYIYERGLYQPKEIQEVISTCAASLSEHRFTHTIGVVMTAIDLAHKHGIDPVKARLAALLHDIGRRDEKGALEHAGVSARIAEHELNVKDEEVLLAIRRHTTLGANASRLDRLLYIADIIEPSRSFDQIEALRQTTSRNLDEAVIMGLEGTVRYLNSRGLEVAAPTLDAIKHMKNN